MSATTAWIGVPLRHRRRHCLQMQTTTTTTTTTRSTGITTTTTTLAPFLFPCSPSSSGHLLQARSLTYHPIDAAAAGTAVASGTRHVSSFPSMELFPSLSTTEPSAAAVLMGMNNSNNNENMLLSSKETKTLTILPPSSSSSSTDEKGSDGGGAGGGAIPLWQRLGFRNPQQLQLDIVVASQQQEHANPKSSRRRRRRQYQYQFPIPAEGDYDEDHPDDDDLDDESSDEFNKTNVMGPISSAMFEAGLNIQQQQESPLSNSKKQPVDSTSTAPTTIPPSPDSKTSSLGCPHHQRHHQRENFEHVQLCRQTIASYQQYVNYFALQSQHHASRRQQPQPQPSTTNHGDMDGDNNHQLLVLDDNDRDDIQLIYQNLFTSETAARAVQVLWQECHYPSLELSEMVRALERSMGTILNITSLNTTTQHDNDDDDVFVGRTTIPFTDELSLQLLHANAKAGNVGRTMALLQSRQQNHFLPRREEYESAISSLHVATRHTRKDHVIVTSHFFDSPPPSYFNKRGAAANDAGSTQSNQRPTITVNNPTRWLDTILLNMSQRQQQYQLSILDMDLANQMISCFATTGKTARALHFFYQVYETNEPTSSETATQPIELESKAVTPMVLSTKSSTVSPAPTTIEATIVPEEPRRRIRIRMNRPPPYYKIPSMAEKAKVPYWIPQSPRRGSTTHQQQPWTNSSTAHYAPTTIKAHRTSSASAAAAWEARNAKPPHQMVKRMRSDLEREPNFSRRVTAAFEFCDSISMGCAGHAPVVLNVESYNHLIQTCIQHGAFFRALSILRDTMPRQGIKPNTDTYNILLDGLYTVGDVTTMMELWVQMQNSYEHCEITPFAIDSMVKGMLNLGDVSGAVSFVQAVFNQHVVLPHTQVHLNIIEMALGLDMVYEAKRHVQFIQQVWKWEPNPNNNRLHRYYTNKQIRWVRQQQQRKELSKEALQHLFQYFGHELPESEFF